MSNYSKYNNKFNGEATTRHTYPKIIGGNYIVQIDKMEINEKDDQLRFTLLFKILEGVDEATEEFVKNWPGNKFPKIPFARPIVHTNNDRNCIGSVLDLLNSFVETDDITFDGDYDVFAETVADIFQAVKDDYAYEIFYDPDDFIRFKILSLLKSEEEGAEEDSAPKKEDETPVSDEREESYDPKNKVKPKDIQMPTSMPASDLVELSEFMSDELYIEDDDEDFPF